MYRVMDEIVVEKIKSPGAARTRFGKWTVLDKLEKTAKGEKKWLCRCDCGTERYVLERALKSGGSRSCGCERKKKVKDALSYDLTGKQFGELRVIRKADDQTRIGGIWWLCECSCGNMYEAPATLLATGKRVHCGGKSHEKSYSFVDITGQRFHRLVALEATKKRDAKGSVIWRCRCDCGNEVEVTYNSLMYSEMKSCGCQKKEHDQKLHKFLTHVDGTSIDILKSEKIPTNNTTGAKGVYLIKGRYVAKLVFQKKQYYLGTFESFEEAAAARKEAEEILSQTVVAHYQKWNLRAEADPEWGKENPVRFVVSFDAMRQIQVECLPELGE